MSASADELTEGHRAAYPDVTIFAVRENGVLYPCGAAINGHALPVLDGSIGFDANGHAHGTRALTATLTFAVRDADVVTLDSREALPSLDPLPDA